MRAVRSASASPGWKMDGVIQARYTRGSSTLSFTTARRSDVMGGVFASTAGTAGPREREPKYFSTRAFVRATSMSPTIARLALLGA